MNTDFSVIGVGSPIIDLIARVPEEFLAQVSGDKGGMVFADMPRIYTEMNGYMVDVTPDLSNPKDNVPQFRREMQHFVDCVRTGCECRAKAEDGIWVMKILDAIYESARTGHEVIIK